MESKLSTYLAGLTLLAEETAVWDNGCLPLQTKHYQAHHLPPLEYVTSVRAILFRGREVMVVRDGHDSYHVVPGGRCEPDETVMQTLQREVLEETGWTVTSPHLIACTHFHHLAAKPADYPYSHPDFLQLIFVARAGEHQPEAQLVGEYELETGFVAIEKAQNFPLSPSQLVLMQTAVLSLGA